MKVLLINPGQYMPVKIDFPLNTFQPLGLGYLAQVLLEKGFQVEIFDVLAEGYRQEEVKGQDRYVGLPPGEIRRKVRNFGPQVVGITAPFTAQAKAAHLMAQLVKRVDPGIKVVLGGSYPTTHTEVVLEDRNVDWVVRGEGELTFLELVGKIKKGRRDFSQIKGLTFRSRGRVKVNPPRPLIQNLDDYRVAWELLPMVKYFEAAYQVRSSRSLSTFGRRWATIFTSRGCPFHCTFCVGHAIMGRKWRPRSVESVIGEMDYLIRNYQIEHFDIEDDNFTLERKRAEQICEAIIEKGWSVEWSLPNGVRADTLSERLIRKMRQAGCQKIVLAPESGDQWVVDHLMKKNIDLARVKEVVSWCRRYGLLVEAFFLIGMPGEKEEQVLKTIAYARELRRLGAIACNFGVVVPHRGTAIWETVNRHHWWLEDNLVEGLMTGEPLFETPALPAWKVKALLKQAVRVNPLIPWHQARLALLMALKTPRRFLKLTFSELQKRLGLKEGILGA